MTDNWYIFDIPMFEGGIEKVVERAKSELKKSKKKFWIATVNPEFVVTSWKDKNFKKILTEETDLNVADGIGLVWAKRVVTGKNFLGKLVIGWKTGVSVLRGGLKNELAAGSDLIDRFCKLAAEENYSVFFLGGFDGAGEKTADYFAKKYKGLKVAGCYEGLSKGEDEKIIEALKGKRVDFLFVAYGMKTQEEWIKRNIEQINVGIVMGVGRSFDYYSGQLKRAPKVWQKSGFEWLYSLIKEPKRWRRQLALPKFLGRVLFG